MQISLVSCRCAQESARLTFCQHCLCVCVALSSFYCWPIDYPLVLIPLINVIRHLWSYFAIAEWMDFSCQLFCKWGFPLINNLLSTYHSASREIGYYFHLEVWFARIHLNMSYTRMVNIVKVWSLIRKRKKRFYGLKCLHGSIHVVYSVTSSK